MLLGVVRHGLLMDEEVKGGKSILRLGRSPIMQGVEELLGGKGIKRS